MNVPRRTPEQIVKGARRRLLRIRPRDENPYGTHMPVLAAIAKVQPIRSVLEMGSGPFSTALFLNRDVFPDLERLVSFEDDAEWADVVTEAAAGDPRLELRTVPAVRMAVPSSQVPDFDLIFIDDSQTEEHRAMTIRAVAALGPRGLVAIHDYEASPYRAASRAYDHRLTFKTFTPQVGVCWMDDGSVAEDKLREAQSRVEAGRAIDVADTPRWISHLSSD